MFLKQAENAASALREQVTNNTTATTTANLVATKPRTVFTSLHILLHGKTLYFSDRQLCSKRSRAHFLC
jgi:hypothetical protein